MSKYGEDIAEIKTDVKWIVKAMADEHETVVKLDGRLACAEKRLVQAEKKFAWYAGAIAAISTAAGFAANHAKELFNNIT